jgi:polysaccharide export outer membrane protein
MKSRIVAYALPVALVIEGAVLVAGWWTANQPQSVHVQQPAIAIAPPPEGALTGARSYVPQPNIINVPSAASEEASYRIEPPDILLVDIVRLVPRDPDLLEPLDVLELSIFDSWRPHYRGLGGFGDDGVRRVELDGRIDLSRHLGAVHVAGLTMEQAQLIIAAHAKAMGDAQSLLVSRELVAEQQIAGEHLVDPDGEINLGWCGEVNVANMTVRDARRAVEQQLALHFAAVEVAVEVAAYNSKVYYVIVESPSGDQIFRYPCADQATVLDAISQIPNLTGVASKHVWVERPIVNQARDKVLAIDWPAIVLEKNASTNYAL